MMEPQRFWIRQVPRIIQFAGWSESCFMGSQHRATSLLNKILSMHEDVWRKTRKKL